MHASFAVASGLVYALLPGAALAQRTLDTPSSRAVDEGRLHWLKYDMQANQVTGCDDAVKGSLREYDPDGTNPFAAMGAVHNAIYYCAGRESSDVGEADFTKAEDLFRSAFQATPADPRAFGQLAMLLAEKQRWTELTSVAREQTKRDPTDPWGWLTLGLAAHRSGRSPLAVALFDSGAALLPAQERARLFSFLRLFSTADSTAAAKTPEAARGRLEASVWKTLDPLWSRAGNDPRTEFFARVVYAELRWTVPEQKMRGTDSDRGEAYIRYGPPDRIAAVRGTQFASAQDMTRRSAPVNPNTQVAQQAHSSAVTPPPMLPAPSDVVTYWDYDIGLAMVFWGAPMYGTSRFPNQDQPEIAGAIEVRPASFDNVLDTRVFPIDVRAMRFRGSADSVDVLLVSSAPVVAIREGAASNAPLRQDVWLLNADATIYAHDTSAIRPSGIDQRVYRIPAARFGYRIEASNADVRGAGRALGFVNAAADSAGFALRGFGVSDPLLAAQVRPHATVARWSDFDVAPLFSFVPRGRNLEVVWETYELGARNLQTQYTVSVTLERQRSAPGRISASILGFASRAVGVDRRDDRVTFTFDRATPASPVVVDHVSIVMADTPVGNYRLTLQIEDRATGRKTARTVPIVITQ